MLRAGGQPHQIARSVSEAVMVDQFAFQHQELFAGIVLMSGTLICADEWRPLMNRLDGVPVVQSHGTVDPLLPYAASETLRDELKAAGADVRIVF